MNNSEYWIHKEDIAEIARVHTSRMQIMHGDAIKNSIENSKIYHSTFSVHWDAHETGDIVVVDNDSVDAIIDARTKNPDAKICVLNFASFKEPGGKFTEGSTAQEESLCHKSFLYNVLSDEKFKEYYASHLKMLNRALYQNEAIYSPDIMFERNTNGTVLCDVLTCAAPNYFAGKTHQNVTKDENTKVLDSRIKFVLDLMAANHVDIPVLGAFGCGVFGQDATEVASIFKKYLEQNIYPFKQVIFAIPAIITRKYDNYNKFKKVFENQ